MSAEITPAIERAAAENPNAYRDWNDTFMSGQAIEPASVYVSRRTLGAALDVEEMARAIHDHECGCAYDGEHTYADLERRDALAAAVRAALLGADS